MTDIKDLSREELEALLETLHMSDNDIRSKIKNVRTVEKENLTILMHTIFCTEEHNDNGCQFYKENGMSECWEMPFHNRWLEYMNKVMEDLCIKSSKEFMRQLTLLMKGLETMVESESVRPELVQMWLDAREERHELKTKG